MSVREEFAKYVASGRQIPSEFPQPGERQFMAELLKPRGKLNEFSGVPDHEESLSVVRCAMRADESLGEFFSRTGLSVPQARGMTQSEIIAFCQRADRTNAEQAVVVPEKKIIPAKFVLDYAE